MPPKKKTPAAARAPPAKKAVATKVKIGVKRERSPSSEVVAVTPRTSHSGAPPPTPSKADVCKTLAQRMGGQKLFSFTNNEDKTTPKTAVSIADVVPYMWKEKGLDATMKKLLKDGRKLKRDRDFTSLSAQVEQVNRRFSMMWNDCVFNGLSASDTLSKVSLDPQAWLISEAAMEIILQVKYCRETLVDIQDALKKFKSMTPLELLLNPETGRREWERVAYLTETYFSDYEDRYDTEEQIDDLNDELEKSKRTTADVRNTLARTESSLQKANQQLAEYQQAYADVRSKRATDASYRLKIETYLALSLAILARRGIDAPPNPPPLRLIQ